MKNGAGSLPQPAFSGAPFPGLPGLLGFLQTRPLTSCLRRVGMREEGTRRLNTERRGPGDTRQDGRPVGRATRWLPRLPAEVGMSRRRVGGTAPGVCTRFTLPLVLAGVVPGSLAAPLGED